ncbi:hypothetical protein Moror_1687 [Moniliophthora roreri MCA 2997]|uniref:Uncharacterized protein n=1 Tax=Moniliophthora roreri (strain MCA 2997) TaxID=1381753 RepID=V2XLW8_MONRO|nr:hypothetical protein Moror_1687 [Moniliophthora roreri MCA 2997]
MEKSDMIPSATYIARLGDSRLRYLADRSWTSERNTNKTLLFMLSITQLYIVPFGVTYEKIGTIQRRLAWPLHKDDTLFRSGRPTGLNIYFCLHD